MSIVISIINNKGGVGKTTTTAILSQLLAYLGKRTLVVDLDQQSNLSMMFGKYVEDTDEVINGSVNAEIPNIAEVFKYRYKTRENMEKVVQNTSIPYLDIIPCSKRHKNTQLLVTADQTSNNNIILKKALNTIKDDYDYIIIDNAPANDILTVNSMFASNYVTVPVRVEGFSFKGFQETFDTIQYIKEEHEIDSLEFKGTFITQAELNTNIYKDLCKNYEEVLGSYFYKSAIRRDIKISEIETNFEPVLAYCPDTNAVFDYAHLLLEMDILDEAATDMLKRTIGE